MQALEGLARQVFVEQLAAELVRDHPKPQPDDSEQARRFVRTEIEIAVDRYGIVNKLALKKYTLASWLCGGPVDRDPKVRAMLGRDDLAPYVRSLFALRYVQGDHRYYGLW